MIFTVFKGVIDSLWHLLSLSTLNGSFESGFLVSTSRKVIGALYARNGCASLDFMCQRNQASVHHAICSVQRHAWDIGCVISNSSYGMFSTESKLDELFWISAIIFCRACTLTRNRVHYWSNMPLVMETYIYTPLDYSKAYSNIIRSDLTVYHSNNKSTHLKGLCI